MPRNIFVCDACGTEFSKWEGRCSACGLWNTVGEFKLPQNRSATTARTWTNFSKPDVLELSTVSTKDRERAHVLSQEVNRVFGGGIVPGSITLIVGDPGIGKSTLLLQIAADVAKTGHETMYVSGEESPAQIKMRADRMAISGRKLFLMTSTSVNEILSRLDNHPPALAVIDSIQMIHDDSVSSEAGSVVQVKECTRKLMEWAKATEIPVLISGHVTKGGDISGPRILEHMVDLVLQMEGEAVSSYRLLRAVKNRFGSTNEVGVFEMTAQGLEDVKDPSETFLTGRISKAVGSMVVSTLEGTRPLLVEIQALTVPTVLSMPRRMATGVDHSRLVLVCSVLTRRLGLRLSNQDVLVNVVGGLKVSEPAADLAIALAIVSSYRDVPVNSDTVVIGEVGLSGELRAVSQLDRRLNEVSRLGLKRCIVPNGSVSDSDNVAGLEIIEMGTLDQSVNLLAGA